MSIMLKRKKLSQQIRSQPISMEILLKYKRIIIAFCKWDTEFKIIVNLTWPLFQND